MLDDYFRKQRKDGSAHTLALTQHPLSVLEHHSLRRVKIYSAETITRSKFEAFNNHVAAMAAS